MLVTLKIKKNKFIKSKNKYNAIATDKNNNKYFITTNKELLKDNYYLVEIIKSEFKIDLLSYTIKILEFNNLNKLEIVNNKLTLNDRKIKAYTYNFNKIELKLIEKYNYLNDIRNSQLSLDSARQGLINDRIIELLDSEILKLKKLL